MSTHSDSAFTTVGGHILGSHWKNHELGEQIAETINGYLSARGMTMKQSKLLDGTLIVAPSSTKNNWG